MLSTKKDQNSKKVRNNILASGILKSVSLVKPCKVVQKQGSPIFMTFCEKITLYPGIVNLKKKKKNSDWFNMAAI